MSCKFGVHGGFVESRQRPRDQYLLAVQGPDTSRMKLLKLCSKSSFS